MTNDWIAGVVLWREAWWSGFATLGSFFALQIVAYALLLSSSTTARIIRHVVVPSAMLYLFFDLLLNPRYTLGSKLRDINISFMIWGIVFNALQHAYTFNDRAESGNGTGERVPRWCVPDWEREEQERGLQTTGTDESKAIKPSWWRRAVIPARPTWARERRIIPRYWRLLPYPSTLPDVLRWTFDLMFFRRHGTSAHSAEEMRGLEWSKAKLEVVGEAHYKARQAGLSRPPHAPHIQPFGYVDTEWPYAVLSMSFFLCALAYLSQVDFETSSAADFYRLPLLHQIALTASIGSGICMGSVLPELVLLSFLQGWPFNVPPTSLKPTFRSVLQSKSVTELWQFRWHAFTKRDLVRFANMLPPYGVRWRRNSAVQTLKVFFCSGVQHSVIFARACPAPTWSEPMSVVRLFIRPGAILFFVSQGVLVVIEHAWPHVFLAQPAYGSRAATWVPYARNAWVWTTMLLTGHWLAVEVAAAGMLTHEELRTMSLIRGMADYYAFFRKHLVPRH